VSVDEPVEPRVILLLCGLDGVLVFYLAPVAGVVAEVELVEYLGEGIVRS
jgi:hypothetical protein